MLLPLAVIDNLGSFTPVLVIGFAVGVYGHIIKSRTLILIGITVIAAVTLYFLASGEMQTF